jgi:hypothetical protein
MYNLVTMALTGHQLEIIQKNGFTNVRKNFIFYKNTGPFEPNGPVPSQPSAALKGEEENDSLVSGFSSLVFLCGEDPHGSTG